MTIMLDTTTTDLPPLDEQIRCPDHPDQRPDFGFGLAGGGYGTYTVCPECCRVLSKTLVSEDAS